MESLDRTFCARCQTHTYRTTQQSYNSVAHAQYNNLLIHIVIAYINLLRTNKYFRIRIYIPARSIAFSLLQRNLFTFPVQHRTNPSFSHHSCDVNDWHLLQLMVNWNTSRNWIHAYLCACVRVCVS